LEASGHWVRGSVGEAMGEDLIPKKKKIDINKTTDLISEQKKTKPLHWVRA